MRRILAFVLSLLISSALMAQEQNTNQIQQANQILQDRGEIVISFVVSSIDEINNDLTNIMSIDNVKPLADGGGYAVRAYANPQEFQTFLLRNIPYTIIPKEIPKALTMATTVAQMASWDRYPTFSVYLQMMANFASTYPNLCDIDTILSSTPSGNYKILVAKISNNVNTPENEPQLLFTSSIHGDETTGFMLCLRMISYLLTNYGTIPKVTNLLNGAEIWICPLSNPEGTYYNSSPAGSTIANSRRNNYGNVDMNRNFPDPRAGQHPDGNAWTPETQAFMTFATNHHFNMAANFHGGAEVANYPWDTWITSGNSNADRLWWERVCTAWVDTTRLINATYMSDTYADGVTEGGDWYVITGGRQDYMGFYRNCREVTLEIDGTKTTASEDLNTKWNENYRSLLNYMQESMYGVRGIITDSCSGLPIKAKVWITGYDQTNDSSQVWSALPVGNYHKYMIAGTRNLTFSASGYVSKTINNVVLANGAATVLNVQLRPSTLVNPDAQFTGTVTDACLGTASFTNNSTSSSSCIWYFGDGATSTTTNPSHTYATAGTYTVKLKVFNCKGNDSLVRTSYITVSPTSVTPAVSIAASTTTICAGSSVLFTPTPTNGGTPTYQWKVNNVNTATGATFSSSSLAQSDVVTCVMTSTASCASPTTASSNSVTMTVNPTVTPSVIIGASATTICPGTTVNFTPAPTNGGTPSYQWKVNGTNAGIGSTFSSSSLAQGDAVSCVMTSNASCASPSTATSNSVSMTVNAALTPAVTIGASATTVCYGTLVTVTPSPVNGGTPSYQWKVNGSNAGTGATFSSTTLQQGDVVSCTMTSTANCASPTTATSNNVTMTVTSSSTPTVSIAPSANNVCTGTLVSFTPTPTYGGTPSYQWKVNGVNSGTGATFSSSTLAQGDVVSCVMTSTASCVSPTTATSNSVTMIINSPVSPLLVIGSSGTEICSGTAVTFNATAENGGSPSFQWLINGTPTGTNNVIFSSTALNNGDQVSCVMTSTASCVSPSTANSNVITMVVNPYVTPSVSIDANPGTTVCPGGTILFTAQPVNGGDTPTYAWTVDGSAAGTGYTLSGIFNDGQSIGCTMTSNADCASPATANSTGVTVSHYPVQSVTVTETAGILHSSSSTGNQWYLQGSGPIIGATAQNYTPPSNGNYYTVVTDINGCTATSNIFNMISVGINNPEILGISLFPNPTEGILTLKSSGSISNAMLTIENILGQSVYAEPLEMQENSSKLIDLGSFQNGIYWISLQSESINLRVKIVKN